MKILEYIDIIHHHRNAINSADSIDANRLYKKLMEILDEIKHSNEGIQSLLPLLSSNDIDVRCVAASHLLGTFPVEAEEVLEEISQQGGISAFGAKMTLSEWRKGNFIPP
jgi:hypothetical protein